MTKLSELGAPPNHHYGGAAYRSENLYQCPVCRQPVDMRDLRQLVWHDNMFHGPLKPEIVCTGNSQG
ncbi:hypothetical protein FJW08_31900 [Mesorhizobium sp. B3-2-1]|nr:hypothetical protein FJW08_31900 [Mesorhizobium sp. B3-2-1]